MKRWIRQSACAIIIFAAGAVFLTMENKSTKVLMESIRGSSNSDGEIHSFRVVELQRTVQQLQNEKLQWEKERAALYSKLNMTYNSTIIMDDDSAQRGEVNQTPEISARDIAIFYNVFIPPSNVRHGLGIVQEQLDMRQKSALHNLTLYYTHIGAVNVSLPPCEPCEPITRVEQGTEVLTLEAMYQYCVAHPKDLVVYIHNKGSYTSTPNNHRLRQLLTKAAFSNECTVHLEKCNVCSVHFSPLPTPQTQGNMFSAECSYVNQLIAPQQFTERMEQLMDKAWNDTVWAGTQPSWQFERPSWVGTERFAMEHWILSHPLADPCDVYPHAYGGYNNPPREPLNWTPKLRHGTSDDQKGQNQFHLWFRLPGRLYEYKELYNTTPLADSWVWSYYYNTT